MIQLANYFLAVPNLEKPGLAEIVPAGPESPTVLYDYVFGADGVYIHAEKPGLSVTVLAAPAEIGGLMPVPEMVEFDLPRVPAKYVASMLFLARQACISHGSHIEALFYLIWIEDEQRWRLDLPEQLQEHSSVRPVDDGEGSGYRQATIEVHSHHAMEAFFSGTDDADEQGFRIYGVIGEIFTKPKLRVRVGCYGHFLEIPADQIFEMPEMGITDALESNDTSCLVEEIFV